MFRMRLAVTLGIVALGWTGGLLAQVPLVSDEISACVDQLEVLQKAVSEARTIAQRAQEVRRGFERLTDEVADAQRNVSSHCGPPANRTSSCAEAQSGGFLALRSLWGVGR